MDAYYTWAEGREGIRERVHHSSERIKGLEVELRGGRRHFLKEVRGSDGRVEGRGVRTGRWMVLDATAIVCARSAIL
ncbi:MAG: hypothetical protein ACK44W_00500 [Planctomycetota bacterium]